MKFEKILPGLIAGRRVRLRRKRERLYLFDDNVRAADREYLRIGKGSLAIWKSSPSTTTPGENRLFVSELLRCVATRSSATTGNLSTTKSRNGEQDENFCIFSPQKRAEAGRLEGLDDVQPLPRSRFEARRRRRLARRGGTLRRRRIKRRRQRANTAVVGAVRRRVLDDGPGRRPDRRQRGNGRRRRRRFRGEPTTFAARFRYLAKKITPLVWTAFFISCLRLKALDFNDAKKIA